MQRLTYPALALLLCAGCQQETLTTTCSTSSECAAGQICFWGECRQNNLTSSLVYVQVLPPASSGAPAQQLTRPYDLAASSQLALTLASATPRTIHYHGLAAGLVQITFPQNIPGLAASQTTSLLADGQSDALFTTTLVAGEYGLTFWPHDSTLPPHYTTLTIAEGSSYSLSYPREQLTTYQGHIQWQSNTISPLEGAQVTALDQNSHQCGQSLSDQDGNYQLLCLSAAPLTHLLFSAGEQNPLVPTMDIQLESLTGSTLPTTDVSEDLPTNYLFNALIYDTAGLPVNGATVQLLQTIGSWTFSYSAFSQANGQATLNGWSGQNSTLVTSCPGYDWLVTPLVLPAVDNTTPITITLTAPMTMEGRIFNHQGDQPVGNATITATLQANTQTGRQLPSSSFTTTSDASGRYALTLPHGDYLVKITPNDTSGQPWGQFFIRLLEDSYHDFYLPRVQLVEGTLMDDGQTMPQAIIKFWSLDFTSTSEPQQIGQAVTDDRGYFVVALPVGL